MSDGPFYIDSRPPFLSLNPANITLAATDKALIPVANIPWLGSNYFGFIGKAMRITLFGQMTTGATPGNGSWSIYWGNGGDANGVNLAISQVFAMTANQVQYCWEMNIIVRCRTLGSSGSLMVTGHVLVGSNISTTQWIPIPASQPLAITCDLTAANVISPQFKRTGSTAETMQAVDVSYEALN